MSTFPGLLTAELLNRAVQQRTAQLQQAMGARMLHPPGALSPGVLTPLPPVAQRRRRLPPALRSYQPLPRY